MLSRGNFYAENSIVTKFCHLELWDPVISALLWVRHCHQCLSLLPRLQHLICRLIFPFSDIFCAVSHLLYVCFSLTKCIYLLWCCAWSTDVLLTPECVSSWSCRRLLLEGQRHWNLVHGQNSFYLMADVFWLDDGVYHFDSCRLRTSTSQTRTPIRCVQCRETEVVVCFPSIRFLGLLVTKNGQ